MLSLLLASVLAAEPDLTASTPPPGPPPEQSQPAPGQSPPPNGSGAKEAGKSGAEAAGEAQRKKLEEEISKELGAPPGKPPPTQVAPPSAQPAPQATPQQGTTGGNPFARILLLPDISAIGDFAAAYDTLDPATESPRRTGDPISLPHQLTPLFQELELGLQSVIDPYARADIFISFAPEGIDVEEAYLTTLSLPYGFQLRAGKFFSPYGRLNQQHPHVWDFVDAPLAMARLVASDVLSGPGADLAWLAPVPWFAELHLGYQTATPAFETTERRMGLARLSQFFQLSDATTLGVGLSAARMDEPGPGAWRDLAGTDVFLKIRPPAGRAYVVLQGELFARRLVGTANAGTNAGGYLQAVWRESAFFEYGGRWELAPGARPDGALTDREQRVSGLLTWFASEFQRYRVQLAWDQLPGNRAGLEAIFHAEFVIGAHGAHPF